MHTKADNVNAHQSWMNHEVYTRVKSNSAAFKSNYPEWYTKSMYNLHKVIKNAKREFQIKLVSQDNHTDTHRLLQDLHAITGYK